jgi:uncharacterized secreted protein with C-terminal beta-propeller domain
VLSSVYDNSNGGILDPLVRSADGFALIRPLSSKVKVTVFDVTDHTAPTVAEATYMDGSYMDSRDINGIVYVVVSNYFNGLPAPAYTTFNGESIYETQDQYLARVTGHELDLTLPHFYSKGTDPGSTYQPLGFVSDAANIFKPIGSNDYNLISVTVFDTSKNTPGPVNTVSVLGSYASTDYASTSHLYLVLPDWTASTSDLLQFTLSGTQVNLAAVGSVSGQVINQFSMDEQGAYFRIATTSNWGTNQTSSVFVLSADPSTPGLLDVVGSLTGIAPGDQLNATRFFGNDAFIVTSRYIDPLFAVDLSNPTAPKLVGELHVPGYSTYLQPIDATHLLGIGRDGPQASALKVSLFDISNLANPVEVDHYVISPPNWNWWWGASSEAEWDHHAFSYFPEYQTLAIPIYGSYGWSNFLATDNYTGYESSLWVFKVNPATGFTLEGTISHDSQVRRSLRIGDQLYSIADDSVQMHPIDNPNAAAVDVRITDLPRFPNYGPLLATYGVPFSGNVLEFKVSDPTGLTASIDWGDGQTSAGTITPVGDGVYYYVSGTHTYTARGSFPITVSFQRNGTDANKLYNWATVGGPDDPRNVTFTPVAPIVDQPFSGQLLTFDISDASSLTATINWGDGDYSDGAITPTADGHYAVTGSHTWAVGGHYYVNVGFTRSGQTLAQPWTYVDVSPLSPEEVHFLNQIYEDVLNRPIDPGSQFYWGSLLHQGVSRAAITQQIEGSTEGLTNVIGGLYQHLLGRGTDTGGQQFWLGYLAAGHSANDLRAQLLGSQEYLTSHGGTTTGFLQAVYQEVLQRTADAGGLSFWSSQLRAGMSRAALAQALLHSQEGAQLTVANDYSVYLHRAADTGGLNYFAAAIMSGVRPEDIAIQLIASNEYFART